MLFSSYPKLGHFIVKYSMFYDNIATLQCAWQPLLEDIF